MNLPNASSSTPTEDPHFAGSFAFFGTHSLLPVRLLLRVVISINRSFW